MKTLTFLKALPSLAGTFALFAAVSCTPYQQQGAGIGALAGAGLGAVAGDDSGDVIRGAAAGAAVGTGVGAYRDSQQKRTYTPQAQTQPSYQPPSQPSYTPPAPKPIPTVNNSKYPVAMNSIKANTVISPYAPYNVIDITGFKSGDKLCDPSTIPNDPATGKPYIDPSSGRPDVKRGKYFIVP